MRKISATNSNRSFDGVMQRTLQRVVDVRPSETRAVLVGFGYFFFLLCSYYVLRPLRDAMGLIGGVRDFPGLFTATFLVMLAAVPVFGAIVARHSPRRFVPLVYRFFAANILIFGALFAGGWQELVVGRTFFVWLSVYNLFVVSIFWSVLVDTFRNEQGRRLFGFIAAGGTVGALVGPALTSILVGPLGAVGLTVLAAILLEAATQCVRVLTNVSLAATPIDASPERARPSPGLAHIGGSAFAGLSLLVSSPYLAGIVAYMLLYTTTATFLYIEQGRIVAGALTDTASRIQFFANIDLIVGGLTLLLQLVFTGGVIRRFGVPFALAMLPVVTGAAFASLALWPTLALLAFLQAVRRAVDFAFARPGREILFTVVDREAKYKAKNAIETFVYRGGDAASSWVSTALMALGLGFSGIAAVSLPFVALWLALSVWLGRRQDERAATGGSGSPAAEQRQVS